MEAKVNVTYSGQNGDLPDMVDFDASDAQIKNWVSEALRTGGIVGITAQTNADLNDFVVDRFAANESRPFNLVSIRPKTPFGNYIVRS